MGRTAAEPGAVRICIHRDEPARPLYAPGEWAARGRAIEPRWQLKNRIEQLSPTFLATEAAFMEDNFSTDGGSREEVVVDRKRSSGSNAGEALLARLLHATHFLLCGPVPNRLRKVPVYGLGVGDPWNRGQSLVLVMAEKKIEGFRHGEARCRFTSLLSFTCSVISIPTYTLLLAF